MCDSYASSLPPGKPPDCTTEDWNELGDIIYKTDDYAKISSPPVDSMHDKTNNFVGDTAVIVEILDVTEAEFNNNNCNAGFVESTPLLIGCINEATQKGAEESRTTIDATHHVPLQKMDQITAPAEQFCTNSNPHEKRFTLNYSVDIDDLPVHVDETNDDDNENHHNDDNNNNNLNYDNNQSIETAETNHPVNEENASQKPTSRKRQKKLQEWKHNIRKFNRQHGKEYINVRGQKIATKDVKENMCLTNEKCPFKCSKKISKEERNIIHSSFWKLSDEKKFHFYSKHVTRKLAVRTRTEKEVSRRHYSFEYCFIVSGVKIKVCQSFFLNTLNVSKQRIYYYFKKCQDPSTETPRTPLQGKHVKESIPEEKKNEVRAHIKSFPAVESHYCRASTKRTYLERNLNLRRMYDLYLQNSTDPVKFNIYETIFKNEFNISFFKSKKDICDKCFEHKMKKAPTAEETAKFNEHIDRKNLGNLERNSDRSRYLDDHTVGVITFDLQNTFSLPKSNVSTNFYKTKLTCYNLTAHLNVNKTVYNAVWHEFLCGRGGIHIASAVIKILKDIAQTNPQLKKLILWSDSCVPQNKNSIMSCALQCFLNSEEGKTIEVIEQKFGEPGHGNVQEIDNAHSCIERHLRNLDIGSPLSLIRLLLIIPKTWKLKFRVLQMQPSDYYDFQSLSSRYTYNKIPYTKVKNLVYERDNILNIKFRESFGSVLSNIKLQYTRRINVNPIVELPSSLPPLTIKRPIIPDLKKKHLLQLLPQLPEEDKAFYFALGIKNA